MPQYLSEPADQARRAICRLGFAGAKATIKDLAGQFPEDLSVQAFLALTYLWTGNKPSAEAILNPNLGKGSASIFGVAPELELMRSNPTKAREYISKGEAIEPDDYFVLRSGFSLASTTREFAQGEAYIERALLAYPEDPNLLSSKVTLLVIQGQLAAIEKFICDCPEWFRGSSQYYAVRGRLAFSKHQMDVMEAEFLQAVALMPESSSYWGYLSQAQFRLGKLTEAERSAGFSVDLNPESKQALGVLAKVAESKGNRAEAEELRVRAATAITASKSAPFQDLALRHSRRGDLDGMLRTLRKKLKVDSAIEEPHTRRAIVALLLRRHQYPEAKKELDRLVATGDDHPATHMYGAVLTYRLEDREKGLAQIRELEARTDTMTEFPAFALEIYLDAQQEEDVRRIVQSCIDSPEGSPNFLVEVVTALNRAKRVEDARAVHRAAISRFPGSPLLQMLDSQFASMDGDKERARRIYLNVPRGYRQAELSTGKLLRLLLKHLFQGKKRS